MDLRPLVLAGLLGAAQTASGQVPPAAQGLAVEDPFYLPPEAHQLAQKTIRSGASTREKLQALLHAIFKPREEGGLGMTYDNSRTRTVAEAWTEGKANCLSLTALFVSVCRSVGIRDEYAEAMNTNHWRKVGSIIQFERHVVALTALPPADDLIADFVPELRKRYGTYLVAVIPEERFRALFYSNRAVEALTEGNLEEARIQAQRSLDADPKSSVGWNVLGVVYGAMDEKAMAEQSYLRAMELDPRDGAPVGNLEALLRESGRDQEAQKYREKAETVRKRDPYYHAYLAEEALGNRDVAEATARIRTALKILPREPDFLLLYARIKLSDGDVDGALKGIKEAKKWADPAERDRYDSKLAFIENMKPLKGKVPGGK